MGTAATREAPLTGIRVLEFAGVGPAPFGVMLLADLGAEVVRIDRAWETDDQRTMHHLSRGRRSVGIDASTPAGLDLVLRLADRSDVVVDPYRPGVAERLGFGPNVVRERNPRVVYARMTGWGQYGPRASDAGHDLNYIAIAGALHPIGHPDRPPPPPLNLIADFAGGSLYLVNGVLAALFARERDDRGEVLDVAMVDGVASLTTIFHGLHALGEWSDERGDNLLDGGAPFYSTYATADGEYVAVGSIEPQFYEGLMRTVGLDPDAFPQHDRSRWPALRAELASRFAARSRSEWEAAFALTDACVTPVLRVTEAPTDDHLRERATFELIDDVVVPAPAPRFGEMRHGTARPAPRRGADTDEVLSELGVEPAEVRRLRDEGVVG